MKKTKTKKPLGKVALKHKVVVEKMCENMEKGEKPSVSKAMKDCNYSETYSKNGGIRETKSFQELMAERITQKDIITAEKKQMGSVNLRVYYFPKDMSDADIELSINSNEGYKFKTAHKTDNSKRVYYSVPDNVAIGKALDRIHKISKNYDNTITIKGSLGKLSDEELKGEIAREVSEALESLAGEE